jgi:hypothetical protein
MEPSKPSAQPLMGLMDILKKKPEPVTLYLFVLMIMAVFVGAWFYFNDFSRALGKQLSEINTSLSLIQERLGLPVTAKPDAAPAKEMTKYVNAEAGFSLMLPAGYHASGDDKSVYVAADPTPENETPLPVMWISIGKNAPKSLSPNDRVYRKGDKTYVLMLHENLEWEHFDAVADSFE